MSYQPQTPEQVLREQYLSIQYELIGCRMNLRRVVQHDFGTWTYAPMVAVVGETDTKPKEVVMTDELDLAIAIIRDTYREALHQHFELCGEVENLVRVATDVMDRIDLAAKRARTIANEARGLAAVLARLEGTLGSFAVEGVPDLVELERTQQYLDHEGTRAKAYL